MEMALGRQRILTLKVSSRPTGPVYDAAAAEQLYLRRELQRLLQRERISRDRLAATATGSWKGL
ncbi:MAG TPA: hypothetical protein VNE17_02860 [Nitrolancea sp.]|nr:hypothetical protein [Nitrolancea sp.]